MSKKEGAAASLRAVPEGGTDPVPSNGLTPPHKKTAGSRFISDVIVELGLPSARARGRRGRGGEGLGPLARAGADRVGCDHGRPARARCRASASGSTTST